MTAKRIITTVFFIMTLGWFTAARFLSMASEPAARYPIMNFALMAWVMGILFCGLTLAALTNDFEKIN